jgi:hypothetical protein
MRFLSVPAPAGLHAAGSRNFQFVITCRKRSDIYLTLSGFVGYVGHPPSIRRYLPLRFTGFCIQKCRWLSARFPILSHGHYGDVPAATSCRFAVDNKIITGPLADKLIVGCFDQQFILAGAIGSPLIKIAGGVAAFGTKRDVVASGRPNRIHVSRKIGCEARTCVTAQIPKPHICTPHPSRLCQAAR